MPAVKYLRLKAGGLSLTPKSRNDRPLDGRPTQDRCTILSKSSEILLPNVVAGVQVSIELIPTLAAEEETLRTAIGTALIPTTRAGLTGMPGVNLDHLDTAFLCLVRGEIVQLGKRPTVQLPLVWDVLVLLASAQRRRLTNIGEVLEDEGSTGRSVLNEAFGEDMICVPAESPLLARQLLEMSFRRLCSFGLQLSFETEATTLDFFPVRASQEVSVGGHSRAIEAQVNPDDLVVWRENRLRDAHHDMYPPFPLTVEQVSSGNRVALVLAAELRNRESYADLAPAAGQANVLFLPVERKGFLIVAYWAEYTLGALDRLELRDGLAALFGSGYLVLIGGLVFGLPGEGAFQGFRCLDAGLNEVIGDQSRTGRFGGIVRGVMQLDPVLFPVLPSVAAHGIERLRKLLHGLM